MMTVDLPIHEHLNLLNFRFVYCCFTDSSSDFEEKNAGNNKPHQSIITAPWGKRLSQKKRKEKLTQSKAKHLNIE
ncbi:CLUMA_CG003696, isoform A [Clunio marinus]|uniref:CLUMA_CG003696, isoform A n=1 Tax=Clunio marinus TaxID=568069 RepID=A0A1J1HPI9_9DIPT|nr:CLUMA_CG003696, isoform A [Clunio marinus]